MDCGGTGAEMVCHIDPAMLPRRARRNALADITSVIRAEIEMETMEAQMARATVSTTRRHAHGQDPAAGFQPSWGGPVQPSLGEPAGPPPGSGYGAPPGWNPSDLPPPHSFGQQARGHDVSGNGRTRQHFGDGAGVDHTRPRGGGEFAGGFQSAFEPAQGLDGFGGGSMGRWGSNRSTGSAMSMMSDELEYRP